MSAAITFMSRTRTASGTAMIVRTALSFSRGFALATFLGVTAGAQQPTAGAAQPASARTLSLAEALTIATGASEELRVAASAVRRAEGEQIRARSQYLPQLSGSLGYTRSLKSQFEALSGGSAPPDTGAAADTILRPVCAPRIRPTATPAQRQAALDQAQSCITGGAFDAFKDLPFGQKNQWQVGVSFAQPLFSGGRIIALNAVANAGRNTAQVALASARAQLTLDITQAYYDAVLSDRLLAIADSSLVQTESVFRQAQLAKQVGTTSEFELLRASVTRDNQRPAAIQRRSQRDVAYLRLKQLLNLPLHEPLLLTDALDDADAAPAVTLTASTASAPTPTSLVVNSADTNASERATVRQAADLVKIQEGLLRIARSQRLPAVSLTSQYARVAYPASGIPSWGDFLSNWTVGVGLQVPLFTGFRIRGDEIVAQANLTEAKARLQQTKEFASLDARVALSALEEAESAWQASLGTAGQASKAYSIAELRYREGISTQIELSESRILMQAAMANRALAARNLAIARVRLAVLRDLPLTPGGGQDVMGAGAQSGMQQVQQFQQQQQQQQQQASPMQTSGTGGGLQP